MPTQDSLFVYAPRRLGELRKEIAELRQRLGDLEFELTLVDSVLKELSAARPEESVLAAPAPVEDPADPPGEPATALTIKQKAMHVLRVNGVGMSNSQIQLAIKQVFGVDVAPRTLSPQLNRLSKAGDIHKEGTLWYMRGQRA